MSIYTIIGGVNGVGKSSLTGVLTAEHNDLGQIIDTDKLNLLHHGDRIAGGKDAIQRIQACMEQGVNFTQETTLSGFRIVKTAQAAVQRGYIIRLYYIGISSAKESLARIQNRVRKGGHDIPEQDVRRRYEKRFADLARLLPYCNEVRFYDNENGFVEVGAYRNGKVVTFGEPPAWVRALKGEMEQGE